MAAHASERGKWTWKDGQRGSDGEWQEKPRLVFVRWGYSTQYVLSMVLHVSVNTCRDPRGPRRRSRHHSLSSITTITTTTTSSSTPAARATTRFGDPLLLHTSTKEEEARVVTLEDVKGCFDVYLSTKCNIQVLLCVAL